MPFDNIISYSFLLSHLFPSHLHYPAYLSFLSISYEQPFLLSLKNYRMVLAAHRNVDQVVCVLVFPFRAFFAVPLIIH